MKKLSKVLSLVLVVAMLLTFTLPVFAEGLEGIEALGEMDEDNGDSIVAVSEEDSIKDDENGEADDLIDVTVTNPTITGTEIKGEEEKGESITGTEKEPENKEDETTETEDTNGEVKVYVDSKATNNNGDGSRENPYKQIMTAYTAMVEAGEEEFTIVLLNDVQSSNTIIFDDEVSVKLTSEDGRKAVSYIGTEGLNNEIGFINVMNGAVVTIEGIEVSNNVTNEGRLLYVYDRGSEVTVNDVNFRNGHIDNSNDGTGGSAIYVGGYASANVTNSKFTGNRTESSNGGAIYVDEDGTLVITESTIASSSAVNGAGIYVAAGGTLEIGNGVSVEKSNKADGGHGDAMYVEAGANASVSGKVVMEKNSKGANEGVYLETDAEGERATLDISGTTVGAEIGISAEPEEPFRLIAAENNYNIIPTRQGDESGWFDDCGKYDIRYMVYKGVPGLYICDKTVSVKFNGIDTLTNIFGADINTEEVDFLNDNIPGTTKTETSMTVDSIVRKNGEDYVVTIKCDADEYRIPTEDIVKITADGKEVEFKYEPDFENGVAVITVPASVIDGANGTIEFDVAAEKYYTVTLKMEGPLFAFGTEGMITGQSEKPIVLSESVKTGTEARYQLTKDGQPKSGVTVELRDASTNAYVNSAVTGEDGRVAFTGLEATKNYSIVLKYSESYRVISRDVMNIKLSTIEGQRLSKEYTDDNGVVSGYDYLQGLATVTGLKTNTTLVFYVDKAEDTIVFIANEGDATTAPATLSMESKPMDKSANTYGELAEAELTGYTFIGWFDAKVGGTRITEDTAYQTGASATTLYAHWEANTDTQYTIKHWAEFAEDGVNPRYNADSEVKTEGGIKYYLWEETIHHDGTSDQVKNLLGYDLKTMTDDEAKWWTREGLACKLQENCKVLANGEAVFSIYYNRNTYKVYFKNNVEGTSIPKNPDETDPIDVKFGDNYGTLPVPSLPGYEFGGWYNGDQRVEYKDIHTKTDAVTLIARWNAKNDTKYALRIMTQDITKDDEGVYRALNTYTQNKTVWLDNDGNMMIGTTDEWKVIDVADIDELKVEGFHFVGYAQDEVGTGDYDASDSEIRVYVKPTDAVTNIVEDGINHFNEEFDGAIVYLYYNRDTIKTTAVDGQGNETEDEIIYGGDFTGHLPPDPGKDGYDFIEWVVTPGTDPVDPTIPTPIKPTTPTDPFVIKGEDIKITPVWKARLYNLTYIPGLNATFKVVPGTVGEVKKLAGGGYVDPNTVEYDKLMGAMPTSEKAGYNFIGWRLMDGIKAGTMVTSETLVSVTTGIVISNAPKYDYENTNALYGVFEPHKYTLEFIAGASKAGVEAECDVKTKVVTFDESVGTLPTPTLEGYRFTGWMLDVNDSSTKIVNDQIWDRVYTDGAIIKLYAVWVPEKYQYNFNLNDAIGSTRATLVDTSISYGDIEYEGVYGDVLTVEATRPGYTFKGWSLTRDGKVLTVDDIVGTPTNMELFAIWEAKQYNVRFNLHGSSIGDLTNNNTNVFNPTAVYDAETDSWTIKVRFDSPAFELYTAVKTDCIFHGWKVTAPNWTDIDGKEITKLPSYTDYMDKNGIILDAVLEPKFTFNPDGNKFVEDGTTDPKKIPQSEIKDKLPEVEKEGYTHKGWEDEDGNPVTPDDLKKAEEPINLKPIMVPNVILDPNGGKFDDGSTDEKQIPKTDIGDKLPEVEKEGYTFTGWKDEDGNPVTTDELKEINEPKKVIAEFVPNIKLDPDGGKFVDDDSPDPREIPSNKIPDKLPEVKKPGYTFEEWVDEDGNPVDPDELKKIDKPVVLKPRFSPNVIFNANGGKVQDKDVLEVKLETLDRLYDAVRSGYTFLGWFTGKDYGYKVDLANLKADGKAVTVYAHWQAAPSVGGGGGGISITEPEVPLGGVTVTFNSNGGTRVPSQTIPSGSKVTMPRNPLKGGYIFDGWYEDAGCLKPFDFGTAPEADITLYARWTYLGVAAWFTTDHVKYINGYPDGNVRPNGNLTRAEAAQIFYNLLKDEMKVEYNDGNNIYSDVVKGAWYEDAIITLTNMGVLTGVGEGKFEPGREITRAEFATICDRIDSRIADGSSSFSDVVPSAWYYNYVISAANKGWVNGFPGGTFAPMQNITRAETMAIINRVFDRTPLHGESLLAGMKTWPDNSDTSYWAYFHVQEATNGHDYTKAADGFEHWTALVNGR